MQLIRTLRLFAADLLYQPLAAAAFAARFFVVAAPKAWNVLSVNTRTVSSLGTG